MPKVYPVGPIIAKLVKLNLRHSFLFKRHSEVVEHSGFKCFDVKLYDLSIFFTISGSPRSFNVFCCKICSYDTLNLVITESVWTLRSRARREGRGIGGRGGGRGEGPWFTLHFLYRGNDPSSGCIPRHAFAIQFCLQTDVSNSSVNFGF